MKSKQSSNKKAFASYNNPFSNLGEPTDSCMDWSEDTPVLSLPLPYVSLAGKHMPSPHTPLPKDGNNMSGPSNLDTTATLLNYSNNQLTDPITWDESYSRTSIFGSKSFRAVDVHNVALSLSRIAKFMKNNPINGDTAPMEFATIVGTVWEIINAVYLSKWDLIVFNKKGNMLNKGIICQFTCKEHGNVNSQSTSKNTFTSINLIEKTTPPASTSTLSSMAVSSPTTTSVILSCTTIHQEC